jgi:murein DD-endopeptidase MepM/ murein hydrolase activator NlpD
MRTFVPLILCVVCTSVQASKPSFDPAQAQDRRVTVSFVEDLAGNDAGTLDIWTENALAGPTEILLSPENGIEIPGDPPLPARTVLLAFERRLVARLPAQADRRLRLQVVPGTPNARPRDVEYLYPLQTTQLQIEQGYGGDYSHRDPQNRHAVDFAADIGTTVIAARAGTIMDFEAGFDRAGRDLDNDLGRANFVRVLHDDGTMALYSHLQHQGVLVRMGQRVRKGEPIALSGNTGYSTGPHLHFAVQANRGMTLESIPFRMFGPQGILRFSEPMPNQKTPPDSP